MKPLLIIHFPWHFNKKFYFQVLQWELTQLFEDPSTLTFFEYYIVSTIPLGVSSFIRRPIQLNLFHLLKLSSLIRKHLPKNVSFIPI